MPNSLKRWDVEITVSENTLNLKCSLMDSPAIVEPYKGVNMPAKAQAVDLRTTNPQLLVGIVQTVKTATDSQITIKSREKNDEFEEILKAYNETHPQLPNITAKDIVRLVGVENYAESLPGRAKRYKGLLMHEFKNVHCEGLDEYLEGLSIYVKFVTPGKSNLVCVESVHTDVAEDDLHGEWVNTRVLTKARDTLRVLDELNNQNNN